MRFWLAVLLLFLLPLHLSWAAMGRYCESDRFESVQPLTQHWDHHTQQRGDTPIPEQEAEQGNGLVADRDCGVCNSNCSVATLEQGVSSAIKTAAVFAHGPAGALTSVLTDRPERPQWYSLA